MTNDILIESLKELAIELEKRNIPLILGGGLSLYIRTIFLKKNRSPRYRNQIFQRSTKDIDIFLTSEMVIDSQKMEGMRDAINALGYSAKTKYFQFQKDLGHGKGVLIDILSPSQKGNNGKNIRIKFPNVEHFHAHRNMEAQGISIGLIPIIKLGEMPYFSNLFIISSFNYIILKLHAFRDQRDKPKVDYGRHHAYDIFVTILDMDENDWENAQAHYELQKDHNYIKSAVTIVKNYFSKDTELGIIRLQENESYKRDKVEFDSYMSNFISDLKELFRI